MNGPTSSTHTHTQARPYEFAEPDQPANPSRAKGGRIGGSGSRPDGHSRGNRQGRLPFAEAIVDKVPPPTSPVSDAIAPALLADPRPVVPEARASAYRPELGRFNRPNFANVLASRLNSANVCPILAEVGRTLTNVGHIRANLGQIWSRLGSVDQHLAKSRLPGQRFSDCCAAYGQLRSTPCSLGVTPDD